MLINGNEKHYLPISANDLQWGLVCTTVGCQVVAAGANYPVADHPASYNFVRSVGRRLNEYQLIYIVDGQGEFVSDSVPQTLVRAGTMIMLFPDEWHSYAPDRNVGWKEWWVGFRGEMIDRVVDAGFFQRTDPLLNIGVSEGIERCYREIADAARAEQSGFQQLVSSIVFHILGYAGFSSANRRHAANPMAQVVMAAKLVMRDQVDQNLPPEQIARSLNVGYTWFRRAFSQYASTSPRQYQLQLRHNRAKELLLVPNRSVASVAEQLGFESLAQFSTFFRSREGVSPRQYRNRFGYSSHSAQPSLSTSAALLPQPKPSCNNTKQ